jgi:hypothetical protein
VKFSALYTCFFLFSLRIAACCGMDIGLLLCIGKNKAMKKIILIIATVSTFAACKQAVNSAETGSDVIGTETPAVGQAASSAPKVVVQKEVHYIYTNEGANAAQPARKKGWSKAAKGTAIGAGSGALVGALVSKKKGKGAIIGAAVGAGAGYIIGRKKDKKDGRVQ